MKKYIKKMKNIKEGRLLCLQKYTGEMIPCDNGGCFFLRRGGGGGEERERAKLIIASSNQTSIKYETPAQPSPTHKHVQPHTFFFSAVSCITADVLTVFSSYIHIYSHITNPIKQ